MESLSSESMETMESVVKSILSDITQHGLNTWEADLCKISILSDSITILTKSIKSTKTPSEQTKKLLIDVLDKITVICRDKKSHSTLKLITLNGLGGLNMPDECQDYGTRNLDEILTSLTDLFGEMLFGSDVDDLILSETLKATQRLLLNAPKQFSLSSESQKKVRFFENIFSDIFS